MLKFENSALSEVFLMPKKVENHLLAASEKELKVIIYVFSHPEGFGDESEIARALKMTEADVTGALSFWRGAGILSYSTTSQANVKVVSETSPREKTVSYSPKEVADAIEGNEDVKSLMNYATQTIGKILTPNEQGIIISLVDSLSMGCDLVMGIIEYCCNTLDKKSVRYIERTAIGMYENDGIDTYEKFEEYISRKKKEKTLEDIVRTVIGAQNRAFSKAEQQIIADFANREVTEELISSAYERTISAIGKPSLSYMSKIIGNWSSQGIKTKEDLDGMKAFEAESTAAFRLEDYTEKPDGAF